MRLAAAGLFVLLLSTAAWAQPAFTPVTVDVRPITRFGEGESDRVGELEFRGGLVLTSPSHEFGSLSGLDIDADGTVYAIADTGWWLRARLVEENGRLAGLSDTMLAPIVGDDGAPVASKNEADAEGLRLVHDARGTAALVSFEQRQRLRRYDLTALPHGNPEPVRLVATRGLRGNGGLEAVAVAPSGGPLAGATVVISERANDGAGNIRAWVLDGRRRGAFSVRRKDKFAITDAVFAGSGELFILERRFSLVEGVAMRIRRMAAAGIRPGATVDGPAVITADGSYEIDNMEGMAARTGPDGETLLTLVSDDNQNILQRTLLLQFAWREAMPPVPRARPGLASVGSGRHGG